MILLSAILSFIVLGGYVEGHGSMVWPYTWVDRAGINGLAPGWETGHLYLDELSDSCCSDVPGKQCASAALVEGGFWAASCMWFNNYTFIEGDRTLEEGMGTFFDKWGGTYDPYTHNPWRSPGSAPIYSPCGVAGGNPDGCPAGDPTVQNCPGGGFSHGPLAENFDFQEVQVTEWKAGSVVEAAWGIIANHGGGYSYRLCKVPEEGVFAITEDCFQQTPLRFAGDKQWVQYGDDSSSRIEFQANYTEVGTTPEGSQWAKNPIPACKKPGGGYFDTEPECPGGAQFDPPAPGLVGYGELIAAPGVPTFLFSVGDYLQVPEDLEPGDYVLSFRWDCEQTSQVWATCSSIKIV